MEIRPVPGLRSEHDIEAWLSKDMQTIIVDADTYMQDLFHARLRFTLAHEIGHCELHSDFYREAIFKTSEDFIKYRGEMDEGELLWIARHANEFAGRLLIPVEPLYEMVEGLKPRIEILRKKVGNSGLDELDVDVRLRDAVATKLSKRINVLPSVISNRLRVEKIKL